MVSSHELATRRARVDQLIRPVQDFIRTEASGGIVLLLAAVVALIWANSPAGGSYHDLLEHHLTIDLGFYRLEKTFHHWINDGAMTIFFFLVGLEIKREITLGELASVRRVVVPFLGAGGGMLLPAIIFLLIASEPELRVGWGIPVATDIAFAMGVLALLGSRVSPGLKALLLAIAIVDDIGAILVIAVFYTGAFVWEPLLLALLMLTLAWVFQQWGIWHVPIYAVLGVVAWAAVLESGVHPTIVGAAFGLLTPVRAWYQPHGFSELAGQALNRFRESEVVADPEQAHLLRTDSLLALRELTHDTMAPLDRLEHELHPIVAFGIVPVFAFANAGVTLSGGAVGEAIGGSLTWGVMIGLLVGKPIGIVSGIWLAVRAGARLPNGVRWSSVLGIGILGGIGFTVSLFITELSFSEPALLNQAKLGILSGSLTAGILGYLTLRFSARPEPEAERSAPTTVAAER